MHRIDAAYKTSTAHKHPLQLKKRTACFGIVVSCSLGPPNTAGKKQQSSSKALRYYHRHSTHIMSTQVTALYLKGRLSKLPDPPPKQAKDGDLAHSHAQNIPTRKFHACAYLLLSWKLAVLLTRWALFGVHRTGCDRYGASGQLGIMAWSEAETS